jgi:hypothetical protein
MPNYLYRLLLGDFALEALAPGLLGEADELGRICVRLEDAARMKKAENGLHEVIESAETPGVVAVNAEFYEPVFVE